MPEEYRISELAERAGVTKRTIHYYISKGLIPPPRGAGVGSLYGEEHLLKILLVKRLQGQYLPLDRISQVMSGISLGEIRQMLAGGPPAEQRVNSVADSCPALDFSRLDDAGTQASEAGALEVPVEALASLAQALYGTAAGPALSLPEIMPAGRYFRMDLGLGLELHYPEHLHESHGGLIANIERYVKKLVDER